MSRDMMSRGQKRFAHRSNATVRIDNSLLLE